LESTSEDSKGRQRNILYTNLSNFCVAIFVTYTSLMNKEGEGRIDLPPQIGPGRVADIALPGTKRGRIITHGTDVEVTLSW